MDLHVDESSIKAQMAQSQREHDGAQGPGPLSDDLGKHRILRTSPLTPVPDVC